MLIPLVVGVKLTGRLREGATATDLVLTITEMLRKHGVVGKFVEYFGPGLQDLPLADRATIANMAPEYGATCGIFPIDKESLRYLKLTGRSDEQVALVEAYAREQGLFHDAKTPEAEYSELLSLDLATVESSLAGPKRPQDRVVLSKAGESFAQALPSLIKPKTKAAAAAAPRWEQEGGSPAAIGVEDPNVHEHVASNGHSLRHGSVVIAAITSCTNTSNPSVLMAAGLLAKKAVEKGLQTPAWVKTSLAPGSKVVTDYLVKAGLMPYLEKLKFNLVGYGCTTCIGNSGPLPTEVSQAIDEKDLVVASVLSGNRNFEGRINSEVRANYLMSPPLVVAFALAGRIDVDLKKDPIGRGKDGKPVRLADIWPTQEEVDQAVQQISSDMFRKSYGEVYDGDSRWRSLPVPQGQTYLWEGSSTYIRKAPYFDEMTLKPSAVEDIKGARVLAVLGDSVTTDHISPAGSIKKDSPAGNYLTQHGVKPADFNSYGSRRGNHEVMVRGTFANVRLRNKMVPNLEGGFTRHLPDGEEMSIYDASAKYIAEGVPLVILSGKEYGSGSSRDWAAKGPRLLGVHAVVAESYERIHRSNLVGMGILPLQFLPGESAESLKLNGEETFEITGIRDLVEHFAAALQIKVRATANGKTKEFSALVRIDTPQEAQYYGNGGILQYVLRQLLAGKPTAEIVNA
jgi:aconitate hydratase